MRGVGLQSPVNLTLFETWSDKILTRYGYTELKARIDHMIRKRVGPTGPTFTSEFSKALRVSGPMIETGDEGRVGWRVGYLHNDPLIKPDIVPAMGQGSLLGTITMHRVPNLPIFEALRTAAPYPVEGLSGTEAAFALAEATTKQRRRTVGVVRLAPPVSQPA
jgi:hypothetical protein